MRAGRHELSEARRLGKPQLIFAIDVCEFVPLRQKTLAVMARTSGK
jgi:hypothetical protein